VFQSVRIETDWSRDVSHRRHHPSSTLDLILTWELCSPASFHQRSWWDHRSIVWPSANTMKNLRCPSTFWVQTMDSDAPQHRSAHWNLSNASTKVGDSCGTRVDERAITNTKR
jgi:hypothetical protein